MCDLVVAIFMQDAELGGWTLGGRLCLRLKARRPQNPPEDNASSGRTGRAKRSSDVWSGTQVGCSSTA